MATRDGVVGDAAVVLEARFVAMVGTMVGGVGGLVTDFDAIVGATVVTK